MTFVAIFVIAMFAAIILTWGVIKIAQYFEIVDRPGERKIHDHPIPLLGGLGIYAAFAIFSLLLMQKYPEWFSFEKKFLIGILAGGLILMIGGALDDRYSLQPRWQLFFSALAALPPIMSGIGISFVSNPIGGIVRLDTWVLTMFQNDQWHLKITLLSDVFTFVWLMVMMYTTKVLDGLDGLVSGSGVIGGLVLAALSLLIGQSDVAILAFILAGSCMGFLFWNAFPAKIFLGNGGSQFIGFMLGLLAILSGGKVATALIILALPFLDLIFVMMQRIFFDHVSPARGDQKHAHFRLLALGMTQEQAVFTLYAIMSLCGIGALIFWGAYKFIIMLAFFFLISAALEWMYVRGLSTEGYSLEVKKRE